MKCFLFYFLGGVLLVSSPQLVFGYQAVTETVPVPYEVITLVSDREGQQTIRGELEDAPEMFELVITATSTLTVEIRALPVPKEILTLSGIIIKQKEIRGIEEIARLKATAANWNQLVDGATGLPYLAGPYFSETVTPGTYRIEVSTPNNQGKYLLIIGSGADNQSYLNSLKAVAQTYTFYNVSKFRMFNSPYVHYPLGSVVVLIVMGATVYATRHRFITPSLRTHA